MSELSNNNHELVSNLIWYCYWWADSHLFHVFRSGLFGRNFSSSGFTGFVNHRRYWPSTTGSQRPTRSKWRNCFRLLLWPFVGCISNLPPKKTKLTYPMKDSGWKTTFLLKWSLFRGHVTLPETNTSWLVQTIVSFWSNFGPIFRGELAISFGEGSFGGCARFFTHVFSQRSHG